VAAETRTGQLADSPRHDDRGRRPRLRPTPALARHRTRPAEPKALRRRLGARRRPTHPRTPAPLDQRWPGRGNWRHVHPPPSAPVRG
jgi:hypothetical protein